MSVFEFVDLDTVSRLEMLRIRKDAQDYWRALHRLQGVLIGFGSDSARVLLQYRALGGRGQLDKDMERVHISNATTVKKLGNEMKRVDKYISELDARLDGDTKFFSAADIASMSQSPDE